MKRAYRKLAVEWHPDRNRAPEAEARFKEIAGAWQILGDPEQRRRYDLKQGRLARGELPEEFLEHVADAIDRAEDWIRSAVLPHYARWWRGIGAEMAARLYADLESLTTPRALDAAGIWKARQVDAIADTIVVTVLMSPSHQASVIVPGSGFVEIAILPMALWHAGLREPSELDDAVLRLLLARYAQVFVAGRVMVFSPRDPAALVADARARDSAYLRQRGAKLALWGTVAAVIGAMLVAGYFQL